MADFVKHDRNDDREKDVDHVRQRTVHARDDQFGVGRRRSRRRKCFEDLFEGFKLVYLKNISSIELFNSCGQNGQVVVVLDFDEMAEQSEA